MKSKESTDNLIYKANIVILSETTLLNNIILLKKKIILIESESFGEYINSKINFIKNEIDLFTVSLENFKSINKKYLDYEMSKRLRLYDNFIYNNLYIDKKTKIYNQIKNILNSNY